MRELSQSERNAIYRKWEDWYPVLGLEKKHSFKWLRDDYASLMSMLTDKGENVIVEGCFRSGKSSLGIYFGKLKELGRLGNMRTVGYIDMIEADKSKNNENAWISDFDFEIVEKEASKEIIMLDELYHPQSLEEVAFPLIKKYKDSKVFVVLLHPHLKYEDPNIMRNLDALKARTIPLYSYSRSQEDMILREVDATRKQADWLKDNLNGNRVIFNDLMHRFFDDGISVREAIDTYSQGFLYDAPYFIQDRSTNIPIIEKAIQGRKLSTMEKQRLFDFGILSFRKIGDYEEASIPSSVIKKVAPKKKVSKALMLD